MDGVSSAVGSITSAWLESSEFEAGLSSQGGFWIGSPLDSSTVTSSLGEGTLSGLGTCSDSSSAGGLGSAVVSSGGSGAEIL
jgi:hypothetical protein